MAGKIALISRGTCPFALKSTLAKAAGAIGAIVYNNVPNTVVQGTLGGPGDYVPTFGISQEAGLAFIAALGAGTAQTGSLTIVITSVLT